MLNANTIYRYILSYLYYGFISVLFCLLIILCPLAHANSSVTDLSKTETNIKNPETTQSKSNKKLSTERGKSAAKTSESVKSERKKQSIENAQQPVKDTKEVRPIDQPLYAPVIAPTQNTNQSPGASVREGSPMVPTPPSTQNTTIISPAPGEQPLTPVNSEPPSPSSPSTILTPPPASTTPPVIIHQPVP